MEDQYILPTELVALIVFWFIPPLILAFIGQTKYLNLKGTLKKRKKYTIIVFFITGIISTIIGVALLLLSPPFLPSWFGARDIWIGDYPLTILPLAYVVVGLVAPLVLWGTKIFNRKPSNQSLNRTAKG